MTSRRARALAIPVPNTIAIHGPCPRMQAIKSSLSQPPRTLRVFGVADLRIQAAADYFHSLLTVSRRAWSGLQRPRTSGFDKVGEPIGQLARELGTGGGDIILFCRVGT